MRQAAKADDRFDEAGLEDSGEHPVTDRDSNCPIRPGFVKVHFERFAPMDDRS